MKVSMPINLFDATHSKVKMLKKKQLRYNVSLQVSKEEKDEEGIKHWKFKLAVNYGEIKKQKQKIDAYYDYLVLRGVNPIRFCFPAREFVKQASSFLGLSINETTKKRRNILKHGLAEIINENLIFKGHDKVWSEVYGVNIGKKDKTGKFRKLGVYKVQGTKEVHFVEGQKLSNGNVVKTPFKKTFQKKVEVKILKVEIQPSQLNKKDLKTQFALAIIRHFVDRQASKEALKNTDEEHPRETEQSEVRLSCQYLAEKVGYLTGASGMYMRRELEDLGFITISENKRVVETNIGYKKANENYELYQGVQPDTELAYFWDKNTVYGVTCYGSVANGYNPILYPYKKRKPKVNKLPWFISSLGQYEGVAMKKVWIKEEHLFDDKLIGKAMWQMFEQHEKFSLEAFFSIYEKFGFKTNLSGLANTKLSED